MALVSMKALLESGVHFGHRTHKWHPAMKQFIFTERNSIHIIDLQKTVKALDEAYNLVVKTVADGGTILFVGTKRQAQETILDEATRCGMPYVTARWLGGMLTNWRTIRQRVNELERLERMREKGDFERITKKEALILTRKIDRLEGLLGGIRYMTGLPDLLFVVDVRREATSIHEANLLDIPVIALVDTNCDPRNIDYIIPSNDDAIRAIKLLVGKIADGVEEGKAIRKDVEEEQPVDLPPEEDLHDRPDEELLGKSTLEKISSAKSESERPSGIEEEQVSEVIESETEEIIEDSIEVDESSTEIEEEVEIEEAEIEEAVIEEEEIEEVEIEEAEIEEAEIEEAEIEEVETVETDQSDKSTDAEVEEKLAD